VKSVVKSESKALPPEKGGTEIQKRREQKRNGKIRGEEKRK
jgi:hypothetical protein